MRIRLLKSIGASFALIAALGFLKPATSIAQTANASMKSPGAASALRTPWGEPDLQGIWTDETDTPLQRSPKFANQEFFTEAQRAELDKERVGAARPRQARGARDRARRRRRLQRGVHVDQTHRRAHVA